MSHVRKNHSQRDHGHPRVSEKQDPTVDPVPVDSPTPENDTVVGDLKNQISALTDRLLRVAADAENEKKMIMKDAEEKVKFGLASFAMDLTDSIDILFLSTSSIENSSLAENPSLKAFCDGIEMTRNSFMDTLGKYGIARIDPIGLQFDHRYHQAVVHAPHKSPSGTVTQVMKAGYTLHGRPLKHAIVAVSSGNADGGADVSDA